MASRKQFDGTAIHRILEQVSTALDVKVLCWVIGGYTMILDRVKTTTKDVDIVFDSVEDATAFVRGLARMDFHQQRELGISYHALDAVTIMDGPEGLRFDLFVGKVCKCLVLTDGMRRRAKDIPLPGNLRLKVISREDVFLFKSVTERDQDLADMAMLVSPALRWDVIRGEIAEQPESWKWVARVYLKLVELERSKGITSPLMRELEPEAETMTAIAVLVDRMGRGPITHAEARELLDPQSDTFHRHVLERMVGLGIARERDGRYQLVEGR